MLAMILLIMFRKVTSLQFAHTLRSPFLDNLMIRPSFRLFGISSFFHAFRIMGVRTSALLFMSILNISGNILSEPGDLPLFNHLIEIFIFSALGNSYLNPRFTFDVGGLRLIFCMGLFNSDVHNLPSAERIGISEENLLLLSFRARRYVSFIFLL